MMMMVMMVLVIMNCGLKPCNGMDTNVPTPPSLAGYVLPLCQSVLLKLFSY